MSNLPAQDIQRIKDFNEVIDTLSRNNFFKNKKVVLTITFGGSQKANYKGASDESLKSFILDYRKIFQEKDDVSLKKMELLYEKFDNKHYHKRYNEITQKIDKIFACKTNVTSDNYNWTYKDVHDILIKGNLTHIQSNNVNRKKYLEIKKNNHVHMIFKRYLELLLKKVFNHLMELRKLNEEVLKEIKVD